MGNECCKEASCHVESLVSIDERGQMVLPKELREKAKIRPGDKFAVISWEKDGEMYCISLVKTDNFRDMLIKLLGPMVKEMTEVSK